MTITIAPDGTLRCLYTETLDLAQIGTCSIRRASHVEPDEAGQWWAEMVSGPTLGPFTARSAALAAEVEYLERNTL